MTNSFADLGKMMESYAQQAVALARSKYGVILDYSENSIPRLEAVLASEFEELRGNTPSDQLRERRREELARIWGGYFGEVVRRRWEGEWRFESYPGSQAWILALTTTAGHRIFPVAKAHRRLTEGTKDNLWSFYQMVREKLGPPVPIH